MKRTKNWGWTSFLKNGDQVGGLQKEQQGGTEYEDYLTICGGI